MSESNIYDFYVSIGTSYGRFLYCTNEKSDMKGYTLSVSTVNQNDDNNNYELMVYLNFEFNEELMYDSNWYGIYYDTTCLTDGLVETNCINTLIKINANMFGKELKIVFLQKDTCIDENGEEYMNEKEAYCTTMIIPELKIYGDDIDCNICLENVDPLYNRYITPCGHLFHMDCIYRYFLSKKLLYTPNFECMIPRLCSCGGLKVKRFKCTVCNGHIESHTV